MFVDRVKSSIKYSGFLYKLDSTKSWEKFFFVLTNKNLVYFKIKDNTYDANQSPVGNINLFKCFKVINIRVKLIDEKNYKNVFLLESTESSHFFRAETSQETQKWTDMLNGVIIAHGNIKVLPNEPENIIIKCWMETIVKGVFARKWVVVENMSVSLYRSPRDDEMGLKICLDSPNTSVEIKNQKSGSNEQKCLALFSDTEMVWFRCETKSHFYVFSYYLLSVCRVHYSSQRPFEKLIRELSSRYNAKVFDEARKSCDILSFSPNLSEPLTTILSEKLKSKSLSIFRFIRLIGQKCFMDLESYVTLLQTFMKECSGSQELQGEILSQLVKQTTDTPTTENALALWQLLSLCLSSFFPININFHYIRYHLINTMDHLKNNEIKKYVTYCLKIICSVIQSAGSDGKVSVKKRKQYPSRFEILAILNLIEKTDAMRIPLYYIGGSLITVSLNTYSTVQEIIRSLGISEINLKNFSLYVKIPGLEQKSIFLTDSLLLLSPSEYIWDVFTKHETLMSKLSVKSYQKHMKTVDKLLQIGTKGKLLMDSKFIPLLILKLRVVIPKDIVDFESSTPLVKEYCNEVTLKSLGIRPINYTVKKLNVSMGLLKNNFILDEVDTDYRQSLSPAFGNISPINRLIRNTLRNPSRTFLKCLFAQMNELILQNKYPLTRMAVVKLAALQAQYEFGDYSERTENVENLKEIIRFILYTFMPGYFLSKEYRKLEILVKDKSLEEELEAEWKVLEYLSKEQCIWIYLKNTLKWQWGIWCSVYDAKMSKGNMSEHILLAIGIFGIGVLDRETKQASDVFLFKNIISVKEVENNIEIKVENIRDEDYETASSDISFESAPSPSGSLCQDGAFFLNKSNLCQFLDLPFFKNENSIKCEDISDKIGIWVFEIVYSDILYKTSEIISLIREYEKA